MKNHDMIQRDLRALWHPCTQMKDHDEGILPLVPIKKGDGVWLEDFEGKRYLDAVSSWWVNIFGHANPRIGQAVKDQVDQLEHVILAGFTHEPVIELSERLVNITPEGLTRCFYADNGSSGVEVALKMSFHFWLNNGRKKKNKFVCVENSYHGETLGTLAVGDVALYKETYAPLLMETLKVPSPAAHFAEEGESAKEFALRQIKHVEALFAEKSDEISAFIIEPLLQCAAGMHMHHPIYLTRLHELCTQYDVHLIADEIAVGFGRTGTLFACEQADITPDFMCLSKGLTSGYLPLCAILTTDKVYAAFYDDYTKLNAFLHSHSYTGNPLACAAALATLDIFQEDNVIEENQLLIQTMHDATAHLRDHPHVSDVRQQGMVIAMEMVQDKNNKVSYPWQERRGITVYQHAISQGALLRPLGNVVYFMPPYVITPEQIHWLAEIATQGIDLATAS